MSKQTFAATLLLATLPFLAASCAGPKYYPRDEIIETAVAFLEQGQEALIAAEGAMAEYQTAIGEARRLREMNFSEAAAEQTRSADTLRRQAITQFALALEQFRLSERINVRPRTYFLLGQAYYDMGDMEQALAYFNLGLEMSPNVSIAVRMRDRIANMIQSVEMGLAPPPENWAPEVEALVAMGPVPEDDLAPPIPEDTVRVVERATPRPTPQPTPTIVLPRPSGPGEPREAKEVEVTTAPVPPVDSVPVRTLPAPGETVSAPATGGAPETPELAKAPAGTTPSGAAPVTVADPDEAPPAPIQPSSPVAPAISAEPAEPVSPAAAANADFAAGLEALRKAREAEGLGAATRARDQYTAALESFMQAAADPALGSGPDLPYNMGNAYLGLDDLDQAVEQYTRTVNRAPGHARAYNNLGLAYARGGHTNSAIEMFQKSASLGGVPDAHYNAGMLLIKRNDLEGAIRHLEAYVAVDPNSPYGEEATRQLVQIRRRL